MENIEAIMSENEELKKRVMELEEENKALEEKIKDVANSIELAKTYAKHTLDYIEIAEDDL